MLLLRALQLGETVKDSGADLVSQRHDGVEPCCLKEGMLQKSGQIDDAGNVEIANLRQVFADTGAWAQGTLSQSEISDVRGLT